MHKPPCPQPRRAPAPLLALASAAALAALLAGCNDAPAPTRGWYWAEQVSEDGTVRQLDLLIVIDDDASLLLSSFGLRLNLERLAHDLMSCQPDARVAFLSADMSQPETAGRFRSTPKPALEGDTLDCSDVQVDAFVEVADYVDRVHGNDDLDGLTHVLMCMGRPDGTDHPVGMGLAAMHQALVVDRAQAERFRRERGFLQVWFVSNGNDCSDGKATDDPTSMLARGEQACELGRNLEDCRFDGFDDETDGPMLSYDGRSQSARAWCAEGDRSTIASLASSLPVDCPQADGSCRNELVPLRFYADALLEAEARRARLCTPAYAERCVCSGEDRLAGRCLDLDTLPREAFDLELARDGVYFDPYVQAEVWPRYRDGEAFDPTHSCSGVGYPGYRAIALSEMLWESPDRIPICYQGTSTNYDAYLCPTRYLSSICLREPVARCQPGCTDCCGVEASCDKGPFFADTPYEFWLCSDYRVEVTLEDSLTGESYALEEGVDFTIDYANPVCGPENPLQLSLIRRLLVGQRLRIRYLAGDSF